MTVEGHTSASVLWAETWCLSGELPVGGILFCAVNSSLSYVFLLVLSRIKSSCGTIVSQLNCIYAVILIALCASMSRQCNLNTKIGYSELSHRASHPMIRATSETK